MSASLVGSEMCIRDRPGTARPASACPCEPSGRGGSCFGWFEGVEAQRPPCLLYTSDAADDM
eukprot:12412104-Alexandrium_andersonii.AAC.1